MNDEPKVSVIILNWNGEAYLKNCLESVLQSDYLYVSVYLADNGSTDGSVKLVQENFPTVKIICNHQNLGFAKGNNVATQQTQDDIIVFLNPDTIVSRDWLKNLIIPMWQDDTVGVAGCKIYYPDHKLQHAGGYITYPQAMPGHYGIQEFDTGQYDIITDVDYVIGAALAIKRQVFEDIGYFDERFFLYFEDVDLCYRVKQAGYRVIYVPNATLVHVESVVTQKNSLFYLRHMHLGRWRYLIKHYSSQQLLMDTFPAEQDWILQADPIQRRAVASAYLVILRTFQSILIRRERKKGEYMSDISKLDYEKIADMLQSLHESAIQPPLYNTASPPPPTILMQLQQNAQLQEQPFKSQMPIIGPLLVKFRTLWNTISTKWYVRALIQQQNVVNQLVYQYLTTDLKQIMDELDERVIENDRDNTYLARQIASLSWRLRRIDDRLVSIEAHLNNQTK